MLVLILAIASQAVAQTATPSARFKDYDKNSDGKITPEELGMAALFKVVDTNGDGAILPDEFSAYLTARTKQPGQRQTPAATAMERHPDIRYREMPGGDAQFHTLDVYAPKGAKNAPVMFFIHGGGLTGGSKDPGKNFPEYCARMGMVLVTINYRLSPAVKHPAHIQDCAAAFKWTYDNIRNFGGDPAHIFVAGHSSGAQLANLLSTDGRRLADEGLSLANIKGAIIFDTAAHDMTTGRIDAGSIYEKAFGTDPAVLKDASPVLHVASGRQIPAHIFLGAKPPSMPMEAKVKNLAGYARKYRDAGVRCEVAVAYFRQHITIITEFGPPEEPVTVEVTRFIQSILNDETASPPLGGPVKELKLAGVTPADIQRENDIKSAKTLLKALDTDGDGKVSRAEAEARGDGHWLNWFPLLDKDKDGFVTVEEQTGTTIDKKDASLNTQPAKIP